MQPVRGTVVTRRADREKVMVGYPHGKIEPSFHRSLTHLLVWDAKHHRRIVDGAHLMLETTNLPHGRNQIVEQFLELTDIDWLWFVDTDQTFDPDVLDRMVAVAHPTERPILGALVFSFNVDEPVQKTWPTIWTWKDEGPSRWSTVPRDVLLGPEHGVHATGAGCVLIHRSVFEKMHETGYGAGSWPYFAYSEWTNPAGEPDVMGEDLTFMARAGALGFPIHVDSRIKVGHRKAITVDDVVHFGEVPWERRLDETYVIIPVKDELALTRRLVGQLVEQGGYRNITLFDNGSTDPNMRRWLKDQTHADVIDAAGMNIHQMWNAGIRRIISDWPKANIAVLNNDLEVGPDFLLGLARVLRTTDHVAVGPNYDGRAIDGDSVQVQGICAARYDGTGGFPGFAFMVRGEIFLQGVPPFDEQFSWWYGDNDWLLELDRRGLTYALARDATCVHVDGGSKTASKVDLSAQIAEDEQRFMAKWGAVKVPAR